MRVSLYALLVLLGSLWLGGYVLNFFGVSLGALRVAGGLIVTVRAWGLLDQPGVREEHREAAAAAASATDRDDIAFFPLTMPFTTGPGSISVAIALSSQRPSAETGVLGFFLGVSLAAAAVAAMTFVAYRFSGRVVALLGDQATRVVSRLVAFLLLCVGVQIISTGVGSLAIIVAREIHRAGLL
jgi:multiple antibiotic resistance protein